MKSKKQAAIMVERPVMVADTPQDWSGRTSVLRDSP